jgi:hypothetical protein
VVRTATLTAQLPPKIMTFKFCELSAAIGYATCYYENHEDSDLGEALVIALNEFIPPLDHLNLDDATMAALVSHLDVATKRMFGNTESIKNQASLRSISRIMAM